MKKQVILLTDAEAAPAIELFESLSSAGISVLAHDLTATEERAEVHSERSPCPLAVLYEIPPRANLQDLSLVLSRAHELWPGVAIVACRRAPTPLSLGGPVGPENQALKRLGFRAIADSPPQLPALLRHVEDAVGTGDLKLPEGFRSIPDSRAFSLPKSVRSQHLRGAFALLASLHLASDQKEAGLAALAGVARLVPADRWSIFLVTQSSPEALKLEPLANRNFADAGVLLFDHEWQRELLDDVAPSAEPESKAAHEAAITFEAIRKIENGRRVIALPLVSGERIVGVLEGRRTRPGARSFSRSESELLVTLTVPIAAALSNSVRIADAERLSLTDDLTRLRNARYLRQFLVNEIKRARRYRSNVAALFLDLDDFKRINDLHGHLAGSHALMEVAAVVLPSVRDTDCVVRYGGDEFVLILTETGIDEAVQVAERIRTKIEGHQFTGGRRLRLSLTASFGVAVFPIHALSPQQLIACADRAMYQAKAANKNCVRVTADPEMASKDDRDEFALVESLQFQRIPGEKLIS
ncbi:MAG TPA: sensor domain-containing diguanylate cyclase [Pyrinomonadaceae bacterium]|nr:sensor domain-containing diguanylate cyclase [Pyrinomonadaceae bacterium]